MWMWFIESVASQIDDIVVVFASDEVCAFECLCG